MIDLSHLPPPRDPQVAKYLDADRWLAVCERRLAALSLRPRSRILDIGTGCGYFPFVARAAGHEVVALDCAGRDEFYRSVTAALGVEVVEHDVAPFTPLPALGTFDAITAYMVTFNGHRSQPWGVEEWRFFVADCTMRLLDGGRLVLELNREPNGEIFPPGVAEMFRARGAAIAKHRVEIRP